MVPEASRAPSPIWWQPGRPSTTSGAMGNADARRATWQWDVRGRHGHEGRGPPPPASGSQVRRARSTALASAVLRVFCRSDAASTRIHADLSGQPVEDLDLAADQPLPGHLGFQDVLTDPHVYPPDRAPPGEERPITLDLDSIGKGRGQLAGEDLEEDPDVARHLGGRCIK